MKDLLADFEKNKAVMFLSFVDADKNYKILRDALIQRFEYSTDTLWKCCRKYLLVCKGIRSDSPKQIFKACFSAGLISEKQSEILIDMVDNRNLTPHTYNETLAERIIKNIPAYCQLMDDLLTAIHNF